MSGFSSTNERASLLGIPRELRLQMYNELFTTDIKSKKVERWTEKFVYEKEETDYGFRAVPSLGERLQIPWVNLLLTCRVIADELHAIMNEASFLEQDENRTYVLDLEPTNGLGGTWSRIPCPPSQAKFLLANFHFFAGEGIKTRGCGGPMPVVREIYQTLNFFIHCGPNLDPQRALHQYMHLRRVDVTAVLHTEENGNPDSRRHRQQFSHHDPSAGLGQLVGELFDTGITVGCVDCFRLLSGEEPKHWEESRETPGSVPEYWRGYGFEWGLERYRE